MKLITPPAMEVITMAEASDHLRVSPGSEDALIYSLIKAATAWLDGWSGVLGMALMPQTWEYSLAGFPRGCIRLPLGPVVSVTSITYTDAGGNTQTVDAADYSLDGGAVVGTWPYGSAVKVQYVAGEGCPEDMKVVVKLLVGHWYENRVAAGDKVDAVPMAVDMLVATRRRVGV